MTGFIFATAVNLFVAIMVNPLLFSLVVSIIALPVVFLVLRKTK